MFRDNPEVRGSVLMDDPLKKNRPFFAIVRCEVWLGFWGGSSGSRFGFKKTVQGSRFGFLKVQEVRDSVFSDSLQHYSRWN